MNLKDYPRFKQSVSKRKPEIMEKLIVVIKTIDLNKLVISERKNIASCGLKCIPRCWIYKVVGKYSAFFVEDEKKYLLFKLKYSNLIESETRYNKKEERNNI
jgi:hypothetical protein